MYYPIMLNLENRLVIVIGGGNVAERKINSLLRAKANITVISPYITQQIQHWVDEGKIKWINRPYQNGDLKDFLLIFIATDNKEINRAISQEADQKKQLVNIIDTPEQCSFIVPSVVQRGKLQIAISTGGASPGLAKQIRQDLEKTYSEVYEEYIDFLDQMRQWSMAHISDKEKRKQLFKELLQPVYFEKVANGEREVLLRQLMNRGKDFVNK